jgi:hypothetical protein
VRQYNPLSEYPLVSDYLVLHTHKSSASVWADAERIHLLPYLIYLWRRMTEIIKEDGEKVMK